jgi:NAD(P)H-flavin reductase
MNPFVPHPAEIIAKRRETKNIFTYRLRFCEPELRKSYRFQPGQFNMVYAFGVGDVAISIASDPREPEILDHTIRIVGNVTQVLGSLKKGDQLGLRGPYGSHWPLEDVKGKDLIFITGGLGCAPVTGAIQYAMNRRKDYGSIKILHGVKTSQDLIYHKKFKEWEKHPDTEVVLTSDVGDRHWKFQIGFVTNLVDQIQFEPDRSVVMICGPEIMMRLAIKGFMKKGVEARNIYLALERNMKCALGFCGHCQYGPKFICKDGPIISAEQMGAFFFIREV